MESFNGDPNFDQFENLYFRICDVYTGGFARGYANIVLENSIKRDLINVGENLVEHALSARPDVDSMLQVLLAELAPAQAARLAAKITGEKRAYVYSRALALASNG